MAILKIPNKHKSTALLILILLFYISFDLYFILTDKTPQSWDQSFHLTNTINILNFIKSKQIFKAFQSTLYYPPLYYLVTIPIYTFNTHPPYPLLVNLIFLIILLLSVYNLARHYFDQEAGIVASILIASYPMNILLRRNYLLDFPLMAMIALSIYSFHQTNGLLKTKKTITAALITALCLLTKPFAFVYLFPFYTITLVTAFIKIKNKSNQIKNLIIFITITLAISSIWYIPNIKNIKQGFSDLTMYAKLEDDPIGINISSATHYIKSFPWIFSPILYLLTLISLPILLINKDSRQKTMAIYLTTTFAFIAFTIIPNKDPRYIMPLSIFFSIILAGSLSFQKRKIIILRRLAELLLITICLLQTLTLTIGWPNINANWYPSAIKPNSNNWKIINILKTIKENSLKSTPLVTIIPDHPQINKNSLDYYSLLEGFTIEYRSAPPTPINNSDIKDIINYSYFIIDMEPIEFGLQTPLRDNVAKLHNNFSLYKNQYSQVYSLDLPDSSRIILYQKNN